MITNKQEYYYYLSQDARNYQEVSGRAGIVNCIKCRIFSTPISDQSFIWKYIKTLRKCEYYLNTQNNKLGGFIKKLIYVFYLHRLRKLSRVTGFQIPPNTVGSGLTIWHWGPLIINGNASLGDNCILRPDIVIGYKNKKGAAPKIGNNVVINSGCRIIGNDIMVGDNVILAPGAVVTKSVPSNCVVAGVPAQIIKRLEIK